MGHHDFPILKTIILTLPIAYRDTGTLLPMSSLLHFRENVLPLLFLAALVRLVLERGCCGEAEVQLERFTPCRLRRIHSSMTRSFLPCVP